MKSILQSFFRYIFPASILILFSAALLIGCSNGKQTEQIPAAVSNLSNNQDNKQKYDLETQEKQYTDKELSDFDNTIQNWGQGVQFNSENQPVASVDFQKTYSSFGADFIGPQEKKLWLTFDEGYENGYTEKILDTLKEKNCPAIFFITGQYARENPDLIKRMIAEGHAIGNHSWSHPADGMPSLSIEGQIEDLDTLHQYVKETYGYEMKLFRYPAGIFSEQSLAVVQSFGYRSIFWSFAYADWDPDNQNDPAQTLTKLEGRLHPGSIYLLHAVSSTNAEILGEFIDYTRNEGYEITLPE